MLFGYIVCYRVIIMLARYTAYASTGDSGLDRLRWFVVVVLSIALFTIGGFNRKME